MIRNYINNDWVTISIFLSISGLTFIFIYLNQETSLKKFIYQKTEDANNVFPIWLISSVIFYWQLTIMISGVINDVPKWILNYDFGGIAINKLNFSAITVSLLYLFRLIFTSFFYLIIGQAKRLKNLIFNISKQFYINSIILIIFNFIIYYTLINKGILLTISSYLIVILSIFKILIYFIDKNNILPKQWFLKLLYICTLQIAPFLVFWLLIFDKI